MREINGLYRKEYIESRADFFKNKLSIVKALTVYKYFTDVEFADLEKSKEVEKEGQEYRERLIPQKVKDAVWRRAKGKCEMCGSRMNLEYDHIVPFSKGGSNTYRNVELLCEKCNRTKSDKIG